MSDKKRLGLWVKTSSKGSDYLSGADKDNNIRYMVFKDEKSGVRKLVSKPLDDNDAPLKPVTNFELAETQDGVEFYRAENYAIFTNDFFEEGSNKPQFNLVIS